MKGEMIRMNNLPVDVTIETLQQFFSPAKIPEDRITILHRYQQAFIACSSLVQHFDLLEKNKTKLENRSIEIEPSTKEEFDSALKIYNSHNVPHYPWHSACFPQPGKQDLIKPLQKHQ